MSLIMFQIKDKSSHFHCIFHIFILVFLHYVLLNLRILPPIFQNLVKNSATRSLNPVNLLLRLCGASACFGSLSQLCLLPCLSAGGSFSKTALKKNPVDTTPLSSELQTDTIRVLLVERRAGVETYSSLRPVQSQTGLTIALTCIRWQKAALQMNVYTALKPTGCLNKQIIPRRDSSLIRFIKSLLITCVGKRICMNTPTCDVGHVYGGYRIL